MVSSSVTVVVQLMVSMGRGVAGLLDEAFAGLLVGAGLITTADAPVVSYISVSLK